MDHPRRTPRVLCGVRRLPLPYLNSASFACDSGFWNSFAHTYKGHGTDRALVAGILGLETDDERIRDAFELAKQANLQYFFERAGDDVLPSIPILSTFLWMMKAAITQKYRGESLGGGKIRISRIDGVGVGGYRSLQHTLCCAPEMHLEY